MELIGLIVAIAFVVVLFLIFRALVLWYWGITESIDLLKGINEKLERLIAQNPRL